MQIEKTYTHISYIPALQKVLKTHWQVGKDTFTAEQLDATITIRIEKNLWISCISLIPVSEVTDLSTTFNSY